MIGNIQDKHHNDTTRYSKKWAILEVLYAKILQNELACGIVVIQFLIGPYISNLLKMNTLIRNLVTLSILILCITSGMALENRHTYARSVVQNNAIWGEYMIYLTHPDTKVTITVKKWVELKKTKILTLCKALSQSQNGYGVKCLWNGVSIFSKPSSTPRTVAPVAEKNTPEKPIVVAVTPVLISTETNTLVGYLDGRIVMSTENITRDKALVTCGQMSSANPKSEIMCRWGDTVLGGTLAQKAIVGLSVELMKSLGATGTYLAKNKEQEIGRFSLKSNSGETDTIFDTIVISQNGSAQLRKLVDAETNARLIDMDTGKVVNATVNVNDSSIWFSKMTEVLPKNTIKNYKVVLQINSLTTIPDAYTIWLVIDPQSLKLYQKNDSTRIQVQGWALTMRPYIIGSLAPKVSMSNVSDTTFRVRVTNIDENYPINITDIALSSQIAFQGTGVYTARACLRNIGSNEECGNNGTSKITMPIPGTNVHIFTTGSTMTTYIQKGNSFLDIDLYFGSATIFPTGGELTMILESISYTIDGKSYTEKYSGTNGIKTFYKK